MCFYICLCCVYLQCVSIFVCVECICSVFLYLFVLSVFAVCFYIWLCCVYLQHMCSQTDEDVFLNCSVLSSLGHRSSGPSHICAGHWRDALTRRSVSWIR